MNKKRYPKALLYALLLIFFSGATTSCPLLKKQEPEKKVSEPPPLDGRSLVRKVRERNSSLHRLDAKLKADLSGGSAPYRGRFYGTLLMERGNTKGVDLLLQVYNMAGVPVLELISQGPRVEVFSPLDNTVFVNFTEMASGDEMDEFPLSSFNEVSLPLDMLVEQIGLIMGKGFSFDCRYQLTEHDDYYRLTEWDGDTRRREMEFSRSFVLREVSSYRGGVLLGKMKCSEHVSGPGSSRVPSTVLLSQNDMELKLHLSKLRFNSEVKGEDISFRDPQDSRVILLTPPVP